MILNPYQEPRGFNLKFKKWRRVVDATLIAPHVSSINIGKTIPVATLNEINVFFNDQRRFKYVKDKKDYYLTLEEFLNAGRDAPKGRDCEDYAIAKRTQLISLGAAEKNLRLVAVKDNLRRINHMVLAIFNGENDVLVLDNQIRKVVKAKRLRHYKPIFALSDDLYWRF